MPSRRVMTRRLAPLTTRSSADSAIYGRPNRSPSTRTRRASSSSPSRQRSRCSDGDHAALEHGAGDRSVGVPDDAEQPAAALPVGAGPGLGAARRPVVGRLAGRRPRAPVGHRAGAAARVGGHAHQRAELHQRDRPGGRGRDVVGQQDGGEVALGTGHRGAGQLGAADEPCQHPADVGVEHDVPPAEPEAGDGGRGVVADAGQREQVVVAGRHLAAVPLDDRDGGGVQPQRPARVAEPPPGPDRLAGRGGGQRRPASATARATPRATGSTRATGVCWSMNSETITDHGVADGPRHGRSRACASYQRSSGSWSSESGTLRMLPHGVAPRSRPPR